ncbi:MAG: tyrosine--tRNA ligase [Patescibacteria group bacterium]
MFFRSTPRAPVREGAATELLGRGVENVVPRELAEKKLRSGERLRVYLGIDPTGARLHLGHSVPLRKLKAFADAGHHAIFLVGSFTAMVGDPTGRDTMREPLTREQVEENFKTYKTQASKILDFSSVEIRYNHEWLEKMRFADIMKLASHFTVQQMLERDMFQERLKRNEELSPNEFLYPLMQGYDSVMLDVDVEIGGNDQLFNMLAGRKLQAAFKKREKFVLTTKLIEGTDGRKMSKTYDNAVYLNDPPAEMFGKLMSLKDELMPGYFEVLTDVSAEEQKRILAGHPKDAKAALAEEIVKMYHGVDAAKTARSEFAQTFTGDAAPESAPEVTLMNGIRNTLVANKIVASNSEFARLAEGGAIRVVGTDEKITDPQASPAGKTLRIGKHRFVKIVK